MFEQIIKEGRTNPPLFFLFNLFRGDFFPAKKYILAWQYPKKAEYIGIRVHPLYF